MIKVELPEMIIKTDLSQFKDIEPKGGLYVFYNEDEPVYIGKSNNVKTRIYDHMIGASNTSRIFGAFESVRYFYEDCPMNRDMYETYMINTIKPLFNKSKTYLYTPKYKNCIVFIKKTPRNERPYGAI